MIKLLSKDKLNLKEYLDFLYLPYVIYTRYKSKKVLPLFIADYHDFKNSASLKEIKANNGFIKYLLLYDKSIVGRALIYNDPLYDRKSLWISGFEVLNKSYGNILINEIEKIAKEKEFKEIIGPAKFNANGEIGCLISNFNSQPFFMEPYNLSFYHEIFETNNYKIKDKWYSFVIDRESLNKRLSLLERIININWKSIKDNIWKRNHDYLEVYSLADYNKKQQKNIINELLSIYNEEWDDLNHPQFRRMTKNEQKEMIENLKIVGLYDLVLIAKLNRKIIGTLVALPNINEIIQSYDKKHKIKPNLFNLLYRDLRLIFNIKKKKNSVRSLRILIMGVRKDYRKRGIEGILMYSLMKSVEKNYPNVKEVSGSQVAERNKNMFNELIKMSKLNFIWNVYYKQLT